MNIDILPLVCDVFNIVHVISETRVKKLTLGIEKNRT